MRLLAERTFTAADQSRFAVVSGDFNPMHMDEVAARRTIFGAPVVHGVHLLCWALESWLGDSGPGGRALERLAANFRRGVLVGETVRVYVLNEEGPFTLRIQSGETELTSIRGSMGATVLYSEALPPMEPPAECRVLDAAAAPQAMGSLPLSHCAAEACRLFPKLSAALPPFQLAALLATTRLVGMECPGLHSLYSAMDLSFAKEATGLPCLNYRVARAGRLGELRIAVEGPGFSGDLKAFLRPPPCRQTAVQELARLVKEDEFSGQRAVVIGGSRGLGEVAAKLLALGGAHVTITYYRGQQDAMAVKTEIESAGGSCETVRFDCNQAAPIALPQPPTHLYYFATPHIVSDRTVVFSESRFEEYCRYYGGNFANTLLVVAKDLPRIQVFYPSTVFLDEPPAYMAEYCAAKAAGEEICRQLAKRFPAWYVYAPRLPRMLTDQNNGFMPAKIEASEIVMLRHLRQMQHQSGLPSEQPSLAL